MSTMLPNVRLMARAFHRVNPTITTAIPTGHNHNLARPLSTTSPQQKWEGRQAEEHPAREKDSHNAQIDAVKGGKEDRAKGEQGGSKATTEQSGGTNKKAKEEFPEAPDTIGMQDERGGKP